MRYSKSLTSKLCVGLSVAFLSACATTPAPAPAPEPPISEVLAEQPYKPFELQTLYSLLVAEIAGQRNRYDIALRNYLRQSIDTGDAGIARHTTRLAEALSADNFALKAAELWAQADPSDPAALSSVALHLANARDYDKAVVMMKGALELGGQTNFRALATVLSEATRAVQSKALDDFTELSDQHPGNLDLLLAQASLHQQLGEKESALEQIQKAVAVAPDDVAVLSNEARLLIELGRENEAFTNIRQALDKEPQNKRLRLQYARLLTKTDLDAAQLQFEELARRYPNDRELLFTQALVYRENEQLDKARDTLQTLLQFDPENPTVLYYLGLVAEDEGKDEQAIAYFSEVRPSQVFTAAMARYADLNSRAGNTEQVIEKLTTLAAQNPGTSADLILIASDTLTRSGQLDRSHALLSKTLEDDPSNPSLLYARSMLNEKRLNLGAMEQDLRRLLDLNPDNATALNALGYTLTVHTERYEEALDLITRALELQPDDPAIMDSMGWVHFRLGNLDVALEYLEKAHELFPDPEVAAHLGEALWESGDQDRAREVWRKALDNEPGNEIMQDIVERFGQP